MRGQEEQVQPVRDCEISTLVPACLIEHQEQVFLGSDALFVRESREREGKGCGIDRWHEQPTRFPALWLDKPIEIHPLIALSDHRPHSAPLARPDAAQDRFETNAVFIWTPELNACLRIRLAQLLDLFREFF